MAVSSLKASIFVLKSCLSFLKFNLSILGFHFPLKEQPPSFLETSFPQMLHPGLLQKDSLSLESIYKVFFPQRQKLSGEVSNPPVTVQKPGAELELEPGLLRPCLLF